MDCVKIELVLKIRDLYAVYEKYHFYWEGFESSLTVEALGKLLVSWIKCKIKRFSPYYRNYKYICYLSDIQLKDSCIPNNHLLSTLSHLQYLFGWPSTRNRFPLSFFLIFMVWIEQPRSFQIGWTFYKNIHCYMEEMLGQLNTLIKLQQDWWLKDKATKVVENNSYA